MIVPEAVRGELRRATTTCPAFEIADFPGFDVRKPSQRPQAYNIPLDLDPGETEAIGLALELHADLVLMDERKGTHAARLLGLTTIGVFGLLLDAKRRGLVDALVPLVDRLVAELHFFVSPKLHERLVELSGEEGPKA